LTLQKRKTGFFENKLNDIEGDKAVKIGKKGYCSNRLWEIERNKN